MPRGKSRSRAEWRQILDNLDTSGLTQKEYAKQIGCHPSAFGWWRNRFKQLEVEPRKHSAIKPSQRAFVELHVTEQPKSKALCPPAVMLCVDGGAGMKAIFDTLPPADYLAALLRGA